MEIKLHPSIRVHPGRWPKADVVDHYGMTVSRVAEHLGMTRPAMSNLLNGKAALSPEMAIRFEKASAFPPRRCCGCRRPTIWRRPSYARRRSKWIGGRRRRETQYQLVPSTSTND